MKISNREKIFLMVSVVFTLIILYYSLFYKGLHHEINLIKNDIQRANKDLESTSYAKSQIKDLEDKIDKLLAEEGEILVKQDSCQVEPGIIVFLEDCIKDLGIGTRITFDETKEYRECSITTMSLNFETSYDGIRKILSKIEGSPLPMEIDRLSINKKNLESSSSSYNWDVEAIIRFIIFSQENATYPRAFSQCDFHKILHIYCLHPNSYLILWF